MCCIQHIRFSQSAGVSQWQSSAPSVPVVRLPPRLPAQRRMRLFWETREHKERGPILPSLLWSLLLKGPRRRAGLVWPVWWLRLVRPSPCTPAEWAYWRGNRLALSVPDGDPPLLPTGPPSLPLFLSLSLAANRRQSLCLCHSNTNCQCVVDLREWQKALLGNLYQKGEVMLSAVLFLVGIRLGFSLQALFEWCICL